MTVGPDAAGWDPAGVVGVRAADEVHDDSPIGDPTSAGLAAAFDEAQLVELLMVVGMYHLIAWTQSSFQIPADEGGAAASSVDLAQRCGLPSRSGTGRPRNGVDGVW